MVNNPLNKKALFYAEIVVALLSVLMFIIDSLSCQSFISYQYRELSNQILGVVILLCGVPFAYFPLKCFFIQLASERVTGYFDKLHLGLTDRHSGWIVYHYSYRGAKYTGRGRVVGFNEQTPKDTPVQVTVSRIIPRYSLCGDIRSVVIVPVFIVVALVAVSLYFGFIRRSCAPIKTQEYDYPYKTVQTDRVKYPYITQPSYKIALPYCSSSFTYFFKTFNASSFQNVAFAQRNLKHAAPLELNHHGFSISAIGMISKPQRISLNPEYQLTSLHVENDSHSAIQIKHVTHDGTPIPQGDSPEIIIPPGGRCDWPLMAQVHSQFVSGSTVIGALISTPEVGYVRIGDSTQ